MVSRLGVSAEVDCSSTVFCKAGVEDLTQSVEHFDFVTMDLQGRESGRGNRKRSISDEYEF